MSRVISTKPASWPLSSLTGSMTTSAQYTTLCPSAYARLHGRRRRTVARARQCRLRHSTGSLLRRVEDRKMRPDDVLGIKTGHCRQPGVPGRDEAVRVENTAGIVDDAVEQNVQQIFAAFEQVLFRASPADRPPSQLTPPLLSLLNAWKQRRGERERQLNMRVERFSDGRETIRQSRATNVRGIASARHQDGGPDHPD